MEKVFGLGSEKICSISFTSLEEKSSLAETGAIEGKKISAEDLSVSYDLKWETNCEQMTSKLVLVKSQ